MTEKESERERSEKKRSLNRSSHSLATLRDSICNARFARSIPIRPIGQAWRDIKVDLRFKSAFSRCPATIIRRTHRRQSLYLKGNMIGLRPSSRCGVATPSLSRARSFVFYHPLPSTFQFDLREQRLHLPPRTRS